MSKAEEKMENLIASIFYLKGTPNDKPENFKHIITSCIEQFGEECFNAGRDCMLRDLKDETTFKDFNKKA